MIRLSSLPPDNIQADIDRALFAIGAVLKSGMSPEDRRLLSLALAALRSIEGAVRSVRSIAPVTVNGANHH
jgi:hypothetical protein